MSIVQCLSVMIIVYCLTKMIDSSEPLMSVIFMSLSMIIFKIRKFNIHKTKQGLSNIYFLNRSVENVSGKIRIK